MRGGSQKEGHKAAITKETHLPLGEDGWGLLGSLLSLVGCSLSEWPDSSGMFPQIATPECQEFENSPAQE